MNLEPAGFPREQHLPSEPAGREEKRLGQMADQMVKVIPAMPLQKDFGEPSALQVADFDRVRPELRGQTVRERVGGPARGRRAPKPP